ncbi:acyltransferase domain-containing protein [Actinopolymorpha sp. B9G3]|uniref:acyltransferase domain-containing protein n=1 Tax=Actinopolymorpha sp. B9G3 TaxID=3158970 RepID=UPI0032D8CE11
MGATGWCRLTIDDVARAAGVSKGAVSKLLTTDDETIAGLAQLASTGSPDFSVVLPEPDDAVSDLLRLAVPHEDIDAIVACLPVLRQPGPLRWLLERCVYLLAHCMDDPSTGPRLPTFPNQSKPVRRYFYVIVFLAILPQLRKLHRQRGIPEHVSWLTLTDLGRQVARHRRFHGTGGLRDPNWLVHQSTGTLYQLGRLQFERATLNKRLGPSIARAGLPDHPGDPCLSVHIPEYCGPLSPQACDDSFAAARDFFARHYPGERYRIGVCGSWLLDSQLGEYLPADSNIVQFQRRFTIRTFPANDHSILRFVFGPDASDLDQLPRRTTLERAIIGHIKAGRHWRAGSGWLTL